MSILSVVFDYGSVLAWPPSSASCSRVAEVAGIPKSVLLERYYRERSEYDHGTIDDTEYWGNITAGYPASEDETLLRKLAALDVEIWSDPNETTVGWLPGLKDAGLTLAILSNMPESFCAALERRDRWLDIFDHRIFSGRVRLSKPDAAMYRLMLDVLRNGNPDCGPRNVLFIDDLEANVDGARSVGMNAELYNVFDGGLSDIASRYGLCAPPESSPPRDRLNDLECAPHRRLK